MKQQFEIGKWYKNHHWPGFFIKIDDIKYNNDMVSKVYCKEIIRAGDYGGKRYRIEDKSYDFRLESYVGADLSEIEKHLPALPVESYQIF